MLFDALFLTLFFLTWLLLGSLPWLVISVRRRAYGAIWALPFALLGGAAGGVIVPAAGLDDGVGVGLSMLGAVLGGAALTWAAYRTWDAYDVGRYFRRWGVPADELSSLASEQPGPPVDSIPEPPAPSESETEPP